MSLDLETYYRVNTSTGQSSPNLKTIPDVTTWVEEHIDEKVNHFTVKRYRQDRKKLIKDAEAEMQKLQERVNKLQVRMEQLNGG